MKLSRKIKGYISDWFLPNRCPVCDKLITWDKFVCADCEKELSEISDSLCPVCAKKPCADHSKLRFDCAVALYPFRNKAKEAVYALKYHDGVNIGELCAKGLANVLRKRELVQQIDIVTCVPMSRDRLKKRRRNHSAVIAKALAGELDKPFDAKLLVHLPGDVLQHRLKAGERAENASKVFKAGAQHRDIKGLTVLICDDVYTTGATLNSCSALLRTMGAERVIAACAATTLRDEAENKEEA